MTTDRGQAFERPSVWPSPFHGLQALGDFLQLCVSLTEFLFGIQQSVALKFSRGAQIRETCDCHGPRQLTCNQPLVEMFATGWTAQSLKEFRSTFL